MQKDAEGNMTVITIAVWENQDRLHQAKDFIQTEFQRTSFNPTEFYRRLHISIERGLYQAWQDKRSPHVM